MARDDDNVAWIIVLGIGAYFLYQYFQKYGFHFSATGGATGPLPFGGGGTPGGGTATGESGGTGPGATTGTVLPSPAGAGSGQFYCVDDMTGSIVGVPDANGNCPAGSTLTLSVNVTQ